MKKKFEEKKSRKFSKCQIFPDIVFFRGNDEKTTISFSPQKFGRDPSLHHGEGVSGPPSHANRYPSKLMTYDNDNTKLTKLQPISKSCSE